MPYEDAAPSQPNEVILPQEKDTIRLVTEKVKTIQRQRNSFEKNWQICIAFLHGKQYFQLDRKAVGGLDEAEVAHADLAADVFTCGRSFHPGNFSKQLIFAGFLHQLTQQVDTTVN
jgi:hypothetical protein